MKHSWAGAARHRRFGFLLTLPVLIWLGVTILYPMFWALYLSFTDVGIIGTTGKFVGLANYRSMLAGDSPFWGSLGRTAFWAVVNGLLQLALGLAAGLLMHHKFRAAGILRRWIILPWIVPVVVVSVNWRWMLDTTYGIVNRLLHGLHLIDKSVAFLTDPNTAFGSLAVINSWRWFPLLGLIIYAALETIPPEYYEAASLDGASAGRIFWHISLPLIKPVLTVMGLLGTVWAMNTFDVIWLTTRGGPGSVSKTLPVLVYEVGFQKLFLARSATISVLAFAVLGIFGAVFIWLNRRDLFGEGGA